MKTAAIAIVLFAATARAQEQYPELNPNLHHFTEKGRWAHEHVTPFAAGSGKLTYHGGPVIHSAHVIPIFWGPSWATGGADNGTANHIIAFFGQFGTNSEYNTITQYYDGSGYIHTSSLGTTHYFDTSTPPTKVTDSTIHSEVNKIIAAHGFDSSAIYEVFLPKSSYADDGSGATSCGGPNLQFCAYHGHYSGTSGNVKYASMPYPSCAGCQASGFTTAQNFDHFSCHETREAVTDENGNAWYDAAGYEADDKCAWSPAPFVSSGYGYQYEFSNANNACIKTR